MVRRSVLSVADQAVLSIGGFTTAIVVAIYCSKEAFALYALLQCVILLLSGLVGSAVTQPMNVLGAPMSARRFRDYAATLGVIQGVAGGLSSACLAVAAVVMGAAGVGATVTDAVWMTAGTAFFVQAREFTRQIMFTRLCPGRALVNDVTYTAGVLALALTFGPGGASAATALSWIAIMAAVCMVLGAIQTAPFWTRGAVQLRRVWTDNLAYGRWAAATTLTSFALTYLPLFVLPLFGGIDGVATIEVGRHLLAPLVSFRVAMANVIIPRAAMLHANEGRERMNAFLMRLATLIACGFAVYCIALIARPDVALDLLYRGKYAGAEPMVRMWACITLLSMASFVPVVGFNVMRRPDLLFRVSLVAAITNVALTFGLVPVMGAFGVLFARAGGEATQAVGGALLYTRADVDKKPVVRFGT